MPGLKELAKREELMSGGHRACAGCLPMTAMRQILLTAGRDTVCGCATGCVEVVTTIFPYTAWRTPFIHNAFENSAATISGVEAAYRSLQRQGKIDKDMRFIAFGGDGGTYDIGLQSLSGAMERGHRMLYVCYDNEAYMNTGIQRSGGTPKGTQTSTTPAGKVVPGKQQYAKALTEIMIAHNIPYVAQATPGFPKDLSDKVEKALSIDGPSFMNVLAPCPRGWRYEMEESMEMARLAVDTCFWPLFEVEHGKLRVTRKPKEKIPVVEWLKKQGRFRHLFKEQNRHIIDELQRDVDRNWEWLLKREELSRS
ncbi:MAG: pyruvate ferredoxin oxidoreductase [Candidatus Eisenbacteria bacterium]|nr:pyruvate ferredoxin oxidoreductase [Candidatus Eisenbacteria bacterium]